MKSLQSREAIARLAERMSLEFLTACARLTDWCAAEIDTGSHKTPKSSAKRFRIELWRRAWASACACAVPNVQHPMCPPIVLRSVLADSPLTRANPCRTDNHSAFDIEFMTYDCMHPVSCCDLHPIEV